MRKWKVESGKWQVASLLFCALCAICVPAHCQTQSITVANASTAGTTVDTLTKYAASHTAVVLATSDTASVLIGITTSGAGTSGSAIIQTAGEVPCVFDGATTAYHYVVPSATTGGDCHDTGSASFATGDIGLVLVTNASAGTNAIDLFPAGVLAANSGSGSGASLSGNNTFTGTNTFSGSLWCNAPEPCVNVNAEGAYPNNSAKDSQPAFVAAEAALGSAGGTIVGCGVYTFNEPWVINTNGVRVMSDCGDSGSTLQGSASNLGGFVIQSTTASYALASISAPTLAGTTGGSLTGGNTYYVEVTLVNGFGQSLPSAVNTFALPSGDTAIEVKGVGYQSGMFAYDVYCSTTGSAGSFYLVPSADFESNSGSYAGPPFLIDFGANYFPAFTTCPTSGTAAPTASTVTNNNTLVEVGVSGELSAGPEFDNVSFYDPNNALGAGLVIVGAQRTMCYRCAFVNFAADGTSPGGEAPYEDGGIAYAVLDAYTSSNFSSLIEPEFYLDNLGMLMEGSDTTVWGGDMEVSNSTHTGETGFDYPVGNMRMYGTHIALDKTTGIAGVIRGDSIAHHYGGIFNLKVEEADGDNALQLYYAEYNLITLQCEGNSSTVCMTLDSISGGNIAQIAAVGSVIGFSDGTTNFNDPNGGNTIITTGVDNGTFINNIEFTGGSGAPSGSCKSGSIYGNSSGSSGSILYSCIGGSWTDVK